jgi:hypothetical protein
MMSNREVILQALERVRRRLELGRALRDAATVLGIVAVALLLLRVLHLFAANAPALAAAVLAALLLWVGGLFALARGRLGPRHTLGDAATSADARAGLKDELTTARWFLEHPLSSPWIDAQAARAAESAGRLELAALLPLRVRWRELTGVAAAALLLLAAWSAPPMTPGSNAGLESRSLPQAQARQLQFIRSLLREDWDEPTAKNLAQALAVLERKTASADEKWRALLEADGAIGQQTLETAALREGLYRLAASLRGKPGMQEIAAALEGGNAQLAAKLLQELSGQPGSTGLEQQSASSAQNDEERDLARLLAAVANDEDQEIGQSTGTAARDAADRLTRIARRLTAQDHWSRAAQALEQLRQAATPDPSSSLPGARQQAPGLRSDNPQTQVAGANVQQGGMNGSNNNSSGREGSKAGAVTGDAQSDPVVGAKVAPLAVQLRQEAIGADARESANTAPKTWFYAETKQQQSKVRLENVGARSEFSLGQSTALEGVAVRHQRIVKEYFMALHQGALP